MAKKPPCVGLGWLATLDAASAASAFALVPVDAFHLPLFPSSQLFSLPKKHGLRSGDMPRLSGGGVGLKAVSCPTPNLAPDRANAITRDSGRYKTEAA